MSIAVDFRFVNDARLQGMFSFGTLLITVAWDPCDAEETCPMVGSQGMHFLPKVAVCQFRHIKLLIVKDIVGEVDD